MTTNQAQAGIWGPMDATDDVLTEVAAERVRQDERWGQQNHPDGTSIPMTCDVCQSARREADTQRLRLTLASRRRLLRLMLRRYRATRDEGVRRWLALCEVSALVESPGARTESEVDAIREVVAGALGGGP